MPHPHCSTCHCTLFNPTAQVGNQYLEVLREGAAIYGRTLSDVSQTLNEATIDLKNYAVELRRQESRYQFLEARYEELEVYTATLTSLLSPIRTLPVELLSRIFIFACTENDLKHHSCGTASLISSVCFRWRVIALNCPNLWSQLTLDLSAEYQYDDRYDSVMTNLALLYLDRSKQHPLSLSFQGSAWKFSTEGCGSHPLLRKLCEHSSRWKHVSFSVPEFTLDEFPLWTDLHLPALESLTLRLRPDDQSWTSTLMLHNAPNLRSLSASNTNFAYEPTSVIDLIEFDYDFNSQNFLEMISHFSNLRRLYVGNSALDAVSQSFNLPGFVDLPNLEELFVKLRVTHSMMSKNYLSSLLSSLTLSKLRLLSLTQLHEQDDKAAFADICNLLIRSRCALETLMIANVQLSDEEMVLILGLTPSLKELTVEDHHLRNHIITEAFLRSLHRSKGSPIRTSLSFLIQSLKKLKLVMKKPNIDLSELVATILSRSGVSWEWQPQNQRTILESVEVSLPCHEAPLMHSVLEPLRHLECSGMRIVIQRRGDSNYIL